MLKRDKARANAHNTDCPQDSANYGRLRNHATKLNMCIKKVSIKSSNGNCKKMWNTLNNIMGRDSFSSLPY